MTQSQQLRQNAFLINRSLVQLESAPRDISPTTATSYTNTVPGTVFGERSCGSAVTDLARGASSDHRGVEEGDRARFCSAAASLTSPWKQKGNYLVSRLGAEVNGEKINKWV